jgi:hypothetical protein
MFATAYSEFLQRSKKDRWNEAAAAESQSTTRRKRRRIMPLAISDGNRQTVASSFHMCIKMFGLLVYYEFHVWFVYGLFRFNKMRLPYKWSKAM